MKEISINGQLYPIVFDMQTMMNFEAISNGKSFFKSKFDTIEDRIAIIAAAVYSANKDSDLTIEAIVGKKDFAAIKQIIDAFALVSEEMEQFFFVPEIEKKNTPESEQKTEDEAGAKN